jgi:DNA-binding transcriptional LysR family regulator
MIENRHLRYFLEVVRTMNITRAAEHLHIVQPALTQNIRQLETELGVPLFERKGKRLELTRAGEVFQAEAEHSLATFERTLQAARQAARGERGTIAIGFQGAAGLTVVPQLLKKLSNRYPQIEVRLHELGTAAQRKALRLNQIDVAMMYTLSNEGYDVRELTPEPLFVTLQESHRLAGQESIAIEELKDEIFVLPSFENVEFLHHAVLAECAEAGFQPRRIQEVTAAQTALGIVSAGFGISILPISVKVLRRKGVVMRPLRHSRLQMALKVLWPKENPSPILPRLLECLE